MRITAGILMIILGIFSIGSPFAIAEASGLTPTEIFESSGLIACSILFLLGLIVGGGICALIKRAWWWTLLGAICSVLVGLAIMIVQSFTFHPASFFEAVGSALFGMVLTIAGMLAVIFLIKSKGEFSR